MAATCHWQLGPGLLSLVLEPDFVRLCVCYATNKKPSRQTGLLFVSTVSSSIFAAEALPS